MSGNIHDTNINLLRKELNELKIDIEKLLIEGDVIANWEETLKRRYKHLSKTSLTLFKYILANYKTEKFNELFFNRTIELMFDKINSIQRSEISQYDASGEIGTVIAEEYIPQLKK